MNFKICEWPIRELIRIYDKNGLDLSPPYQRNPIWTVNAQKKLLKSILIGKPIPNFFLLQKDADSYEMIDGQQRARTILGYWRNIVVDHENLTFEKRFKNQNYEQTSSQFLDYKLSVTVITKILDNEPIEEYYALLNSSGLRLNRPELKKAEYFTTNFLKLVLNCAENEILINLKLFKEVSSNRMNDVDFVSELITSMKFGISDKKEKVDQLYEDDISLEELDLLKIDFDKQMQVFNRLNHLTPIVRTRYKQKSDFYSLFYLLFSNREEPSDILDHFYKVLVKIGPHIRPSQTECEPLKDYAYHCVTQSNSKISRQARHDILTELLLNKNNNPSPTQEAVLNYFRLSRSNLVKIGKFWTLNPSQLHDPHNYELDFK